MPTSWKRADDSALRAHLQEAIAQRIATDNASDWSYSDYDVAAIRAELNDRQVASAALAKDVAARRLADPSSGVECGASGDPPATIDPEAVHLRILIARCFKPTRRQAHGGARGETGTDSAERSWTQRREPRMASHIVARLQRLR